MIAFNVIAQGVFVYGLDVRAWIISSALIRVPSCSYSI